MKNVISILVAVLIAASVFSQAPQKMNYQAVIRNSGGELVTSATVGMQISILQTSSEGNAVYVETQTPTTNGNGLATLEIGTGTLVSGSFSTISWGTDAYFVKTEIDPLGGNTYTITGTSQLNSVPYALFSASSTSFLSAGTAVGNTTFWDGFQWEHNSSNIYNNGANIGVGTASPDASAKLDISSTTSGLLLPRMTTAQRNSIIAPAEGLIIYNITSKCFEVWSGSSWMSFCEGACVPAPTAASAGANVNTVSTSINLDGNTPVSGTGAWSIISGAGGNVANFSSPTSSFTGVSGTIYILQWAITNTCGISSDEVEIGFICPSGFGDCNGSSIDGCEVNLNTSASNCGSCGNVCILANANAGCVNGACVIANCNSGFVDCNGLTGDGCETNTNNDSTNCGTCGFECPPGTSCIAGNCQ